MASSEQQSPEHAQDPRLVNFFAGCADGSRYVVHDVLGQGSYGLVVGATDRFTGERVAIKKMLNAFEYVADTTRILREITLLRLIKHQDIVELKHILLPTDPLTFRDIFVVFELQETDLHIVIGANDDLSPDHHKVFLYQLLRGLNFVHQCGVLHRDLKPKNILANSNCKLKLCDFGLARPVLPHTPSNTVIGWTDYVATRWYRAPELCGCFYGFYTEAVDIWSLGCIYAELILGQPLFRGWDPISQIKVITDLTGKPSNEAIQKIGNLKARHFLQAMPHKDPVCLTQRFPGVDPEGLDLLSQLLAFDPEDRPTAAEALTHPYFRTLPVPPQNVPVSVGEHFEFEKWQLTHADIRQLVYIEILHYHPRIQALHADRSQQQVAASMSLLVDQYGPYNSHAAPANSAAVNPAAPYDPRLCKHCQQFQDVCQQCRIHAAALSAGPAVGMPSYPQVQQQMYMPHPHAPQQQQQMYHADSNTSVLLQQAASALQQQAIQQQAMATHLQQHADPGASVDSGVHQGGGVFSSPANGQPLQLQEQQASS